MKKSKRSARFIKDISVHTPFVEMLALLIVLWLIFAAGLYLFEANVSGSAIHSYGDALYWGVAAFSTAGIADAPISGAAHILGGIWIVIGSTLFFGTIVATVTAYFMRPLQRPHRQIIDTIEYNLEQLTELDIEELDLLKDTVDALILHVEGIKRKQSI
ncbi:two pore domain potassium channel family protein [uncultured Shewanella sp.]|uniref:two pore domain potassium channel family protein n=1 Tax=Shewanella atlantica TaxID=271099 RepID=UPI0026245463|nr:two pore domain potassium channel family protein [uncultured Shewanella sp.]